MMMKKDHLSRSVSHCSVYVIFDYDNEKVSNWKQYLEWIFQVCLLIYLTVRLMFCVENIEVGLDVLRLNAAWGLSRSTEFGYSVSNWKQTLLLLY